MANDIIDDSVCSINPEIDLDLSKDQLYCCLQRVIAMAEVACNAPLYTKPSTQHNYLSEIHELMLQARRCYDRCFSDKKRTSSLTRDTDFLIKQRYLGILDRLMLSARRCIREIQINDLKNVVKH